MVDWIETREAIEKSENIADLIMKEFSDKKISLLVGIGALSKIIGMAFAQQGEDFEKSVWTLIQKHKEIYLELFNQADDLS